MALFRQFLLNSKVQYTLSRLRYKTFAIGAYFQKINNKYTLKLSFNMKRREWFEGLWNHSNQVNTTITAYCKLKITTSDSECGQTIL